MSLKLVKPDPVICWPWHLRCLADDGQHPRGDNCIHCGRDVAVPTRSFGAPICLYCGMDLGLVEIVEIPLFEEGS